MTQENLWINHDGRACPFEAGRADRLEVKLASGEIMDGFPHDFEWKANGVNAGIDWDITHYRIRP